MRPLILVWALFIASAYMILCDARCPLFIIGHMAIEMGTAKWFLENGANALETDIQFDSYGNPTKIYHGWPCDCSRNCFEEADIEDYLKELNRIRSVYSYYGKGELHFLMLDLKASSISGSRYSEAGFNLGIKIAYGLWDRIAIQPEREMAVILSVPAAKYIPVLAGVRRAIEQIKGRRYVDLLGYGIDDFSEGAANISSKFRLNGIHHHRWIGTGISNCFPYWAATEENNLLHCRHRQSSRCGLVDKAFHWTIDAKSSIKKAIQRGYDAVITNNPKNAILAVRELGVKIANKQNLWSSGC